VSCRPAAAGVAVSAVDPRFPAFRSTADPRLTALLRRATQPRRTLVVGAHATGTGSGARLGAREAAHSAGWRTAGDGPGRRGARLDRPTRGGTGRAVFQNAVSGKRPAHRGQVSADDQVGARRYQSGGAAEPATGAGLQLEADQLR